ncbi:MAG: MEMAR_RS02690 family S-layer glycoprotein [Methanomicrobiales archaeon]
MKSTTKLLIVALVVFLVAMGTPASARGASIKNIVSGDHVFVYETGLNVAALDGDSGTGGVQAPTSLRKFVDDDVTKAIIKDIPVSDPNNFNVDTAVVGGVYGVYYPFTSGGAGKANAGMSITLEATDLSLGLYLTNHIDSIDGKSITRATAIAFKVLAPDFGTYYKVGALYVGQADIRITTPDGGQVTVFGHNNVNLGKMNISGSSFFTDTGGPAAAIDLTGVTAGTYTAVMKFSSGQDFYKQAGTDSNAVTFTVLSKPITLTTNKETVVRGNAFSVTITGESNKAYFLYIKSASVATVKMPMVQGWEVNAQPGVNNTANGTFGDFLGGSSGIGYLCNLVANDVDGCMSNSVNAITGYRAPNNGTYALVTTQADGTRSVLFNTSGATDDKKFTLKALDPSDTSKYDTVDVSVQKGAVTITYEGTGSYYLGETIKLSGTDTDSTKVYLFVKGPNLGDNGRSLSNLSQTTYTDCAGAAASGAAPNANECWKQVDVNTDNTWSYKWDTSRLVPSGAFSLDAGTYTIYAVAEPADGTTDGLSKPAEKIYQTASVVLKKPFVTAAASTGTLAKGDILYVRGTAEGKPNNVYVWIFGKNYRSCSNSQSVNSDATYEYKLDRADTEPLYAGQYFVVVQHPMMNGVADVIGTDAAGTTSATGTSCAAASGNPSTTWTGGAPTVQISGLQASDAATALVDLLNSPNVDDTYTKLSFMIEEPWIRIDTIGDKYVGDTFTITGTTNLAEGDTILMTVTSSSFQPTEKTQTGEFSGSSGSVTVQAGDTYNTFSFDVDASTYKPDEYLVKAEAVEPSQTTTATFNVLEGKPTTVATTVPATPVVTAVQTPVVTEVTTAVPVTTAKPQPGFGALVALVGLGAVALLVLRRR